MTEKSTPLFSFGIVADPQYADADPRPDMGRFYAESPKKLAEAIDVFNREDLAFVVTLGDIIDRGFENFDAILSVYDALRHPRCCCRAITISPSLPSIFPPSMPASA